MILKDLFIKKAIKIYKEAEAPKGWKEFLKEKYEGGKKKLPNTNPKTKAKYPEVSMLTLFKNDDSFKSKVQKEFKDWSKDYKPTNVPDKNRYVFNVSSDISKLATEFFSGKEAKDAGFDYDLAKYGKTTKALETTVDSEQAIARQKWFESYMGSDLDAYAEFRRGWQTDSSSLDAFRASSVFENLGVPYDKDFPFKQDPKFKEGLGQGDTPLEKALVKVYTATQAFFKANGIKKLKIYRSVKHVYDNDIPIGAKVRNRNRALSSWTGSPLVANSFERKNVAKVLEMTVPVENILVAPMIDVAFSFDSIKFYKAPPSERKYDLKAKLPFGFQEDEYVIIGAHDKTVTNVEVKQGTSTIDWDEDQTDREMLGQRFNNIEVIRG
jgi:hypothetical protein